MLQKPQFLAILASIALFCILFFGFSNVSPTYQGSSSAGDVAAIESKIYSFLSDSKAELTGVERDYLRLIEGELKEGNSDTVNVQAYKKLASFWFDKDRLELSGHYAEQVAKELEDENAWSIAGTTYGFNLDAETTIEKKDYRRSKGVQCLEHAVSMNPENISHRINLALMYVSHPLEENPMKGIQMLLKLNEENPNSPDVLYHLGRLAIRTNQLEKAEERLLKAYTLEPSSKRIACLLSEIYRETGKMELQMYQTVCNISN